jgi:anti-sigma factor RsiW
MTTHAIDSQLHDLVDDDIAAAERPALEAHLAACGECADRLRSLMALRAQLRALPLSVEPPGDLLPGIRARIRGAPQSLAARRVRWPLLAAAAVLLCVLSSAITLFIVRGTRTPPPLSQLPVAVATAQLVELRATEAHYIGAIAELRAALLRDQAMLGPETVRVLEQSLAAIDRALADAHAALLADPANGVLAEMLHANYQKKLDLLRRANLHARARL